MRKLASIQRIIRLEPIDGKDRIELAFIKGWQVIVKKNEFKVGDLCVYVEIDSILPEKPEFEFLRSKNFRIKTIKMGGVLSQGIAFPLSILPGSLYQEGDDVTDVIGVIKYDEYKEEAEKKPEEKKSRLKCFLKRHKITRWLIVKKKRKDEFPSFIKKTDETRIQNAPWYLENKSEFIVTEKLDGTSSTYFIRRNRGFKSLVKKYEVGVCSRNRFLPMPDDSVYWKMETKYGIFRVLFHLITQFPYIDFICLQGETIGCKLQGNPYKLDDNKFYAFNLIIGNIDRHGNAKNSKRIDSVSAKGILESYGIKFVPILNEKYRLPDTIDEILKAADGESVIAPVSREGFVIRNYEGNISFKVVSNEYLLKNNK